MTRRSSSVPESINVLLDQNVPRAVKTWLLGIKPHWKIYLTSDVALDGASDERVFSWAQEHEAMIITFDQDFADQRSFGSKHHVGIVRLRIWPTTVEETQNALSRLFSQTDEAKLKGALVIVDQDKIRIRFRHK